MKALLDEGVPEGLVPYLVGHETSTVKRQGWNSIKNGKLLDLMERSGFEALITSDKRMEHEQQLKRRPFVTLLLSTNHWPTLEPNAAKVRMALNEAKPGEVLKVDCGKFTPKRFGRFGL